ncbi:MAG TPA: hypothetical protein PK836_08450 [Syntrophales bacterium]|mgnify:CR=1 FL=1|nr:hypothetical protein [Syntrophales bacterium]HOM06475.1 hypothetical protein [Syntrophales bacterium]HOO00891.1 hypothetical protein [Syntrophales bacterium]HPC01696.1 hypothetical protein [Syntrophales bacterium]HPQ06263.1 hypothetical protein [Syntrophales bacterium]
MVTTGKEFFEAAELWYRWQKSAREAFLEACRGSWGRTAWGEAFKTIAPCRPEGLVPGMKDVHEALRGWADLVRCEQENLLRLQRAWTAWAQKAGGPAGGTQQAGEALAAFLDEWEAVVNEATRSRFRFLRRLMAPGGGEVEKREETKAGG